LKYANSTQAPNVKNRSNLRLVVKATARTDPGGATGFVCRRWFAKVPNEKVREKDKLKLDNRVTEKLAGAEREIRRLVTGVLTQNLANEIGLKKFAIC